MPSSSHSLYRVHRPLHFSDLIGQESVATTLQQALLQDRVAHAYLFSGPRGTGKTSTARIFARAISCLKPVKKTNSFEPCGSCEACQNLLSGNTPDIVEIDAASNRGIEDVRELREQVRYHPLQLQRKIYIVDEVHMLTTEAFNALLKTLEEPPDHALFILATTEFQKVPLTIRSRCQLVRFQRGSIDSINKLLEQIIKKEQLAVEPEAAALIATHAEGGYRDALTLLETLTTRHTPLRLIDTTAALGLLPTEQADALLSAALAQDTAATIHQLTAQTELLAGSVEPLLNQLINRLRQALLPGQGPADDFLTLARSRPLPQLTYALDQLMEAFILQRSSPLPSLPLEIALLRIASWEGVTGKPTDVQVDRAILPPRSTPQRSSTTVHNPASPPQPASITIPTVHPISTPQSATPTVPVVELFDSDHTSITDPRKAWRLMVEEVCRVNLALGQALKQAVFHTAENGVITIHVRYKFHADKMSEKKNHHLILGILHRLTGQDWRVVYEVSASVPRRTPPKQIGTGPSEAAEVFGSNPT